MGVFSEIFTSMFSQNTIGWLVITLIILLFSFGGGISFYIKKYYKTLNEDMRVNLSLKKDIRFHSNELNNILSEFTSSTMAGTDNINTPVIIERNINNKVIRLQGILKLISPTLIALGLLGTFLGLTIAIAETKTALNGIASINTFSTALQSPIASMATAFWTSIFGVICSVVLNFINSFFTTERSKFYDELENYLDNEVFSKRAKTFNTIFEEFSIMVKTTMLTLTEEMTVLFKNGVEELVSKINANSIDLTNSAEALKDYTGKFKELVSEMDNTVKNFNEPVENFNDSVKDFIIVSSSLENRFNESFTGFNNSVEKLDGSMKVLDKNMSDSINLLSNDMSGSMSELSVNITGTMALLSNNIDSSMSVFSEKTDNSVNSLSINIDKSFGNMSKVIKTSLENFSFSINENMTEGSKNFKESIKDVAVELNSSLSIFSEKTDNSVNSLSRNIDKSFGSMSKVIEISLGNFSSSINKNMIEGSKSFKESMNEVAVELNSSFNTMEKGYKENNLILEALIKVVKKEGELTDERANRLNELINTINKINEIRDDENAEMMERLKDSYYDFKNVIEEFKGSLKGINSAVSEELAKALELKLNEIGKEFSKDLSRDIKLVVNEIGEATESLNESVSIVGELVKASNDWASAVAYSLNDGGSDSIR